MTFSCNGADPRVMCIEGCNLGCSSTGCSLTDIAQNQVVILNFSDEIDPNTVSPSSIRFRTATGDQPVGEFLVSGKRVEFVPTLAISGGQTFFGFAAGETYTMTIPGGDGQVAALRSTSGKPLERTLTCTLAATRGIVDLNGVAPSAVMVVPPQERLANAPRTTDIVIEFNEMIDATPFLSGSQSPVAFTVRRNVEVPSGSGNFQCDPASTARPLAGTQNLTFDAGRGISVLTFHPVQQLPGNVCVEVNVTDGVADLSGRPAQPQTLSFRTEIVPLVDRTIAEEFDNNDKLDPETSAAAWGGGVASFFKIGGDGRHGAFTTAYLTETLPTPVPGKHVFTINTDSQVIPAAFTSTGAAIAVTDGKFFFASMQVPSDVVLRFAGSRPPVITVCGRCDILGELSVAGASTLAPTTGGATGQPGGAAGAGGGAGGQGGDKITSTQAGVGGVGALPTNQGRNGSNAIFLTGHGYETTAFNTGGRGSTVFPASGLNSGLFYGPGTVAYTPMASAAGGGGGFLQPGAPGRVVSNNHPDSGLTNLVATAAGADTITVASANWIVNRYAPSGTPAVARTITITAGTGAGQARTIVSNTANTITVNAPWATPPVGGTFSVTTGAAPNLDYMGPVAVGGTALQLFPFPAATGFSKSSQHFLVGGSGGGGSASSAALALGIVPDRWSAGLGGGGGGGAIALRGGNLLRLAPGSKVLATGGNASGGPATASPSVMSPAGGGSGGSIVLQAGHDFEISGLVDVRGGTGSSITRSSSPSTPPAGATVQLQGGNGANGFVRFEAPTAQPLSALATMQPPAIADNLGVLTERDDLVACNSRFYSTGEIFGPEFARYEIHGTIDGVPFVYSDDPAVSTQVAGPGAAVRALFQAAQLDIVTNEPQQFGPWRTGVRTAGSVVGINSDGFNGFRFRLIADYTLGAVITVDRVVVVYRV